MSDDEEKLSEEKLTAIVERYDQPRLVVSDAYADGGADPLWPRFVRAAMVQIDDGDAFLARYSIWANTVRDNLIEAMNAMDAGDVETARRHLVRSANSLSAFSDVQSYFDPMNIGNRT